MVKEQRPEHKQRDRRSHDNQHESTAKANHASPALRRGMSSPETERDDQSNRTNLANQPISKCCCSVKTVSVSCSGTLPFSATARPGRRQEDAWGYLEVMRDTVRRDGVPGARHCDRRGIFEAHGRAALTLEDQLADTRAPTQLAGRSKGRLERSSCLPP